MPQNNTTFGKKGNFLSNITKGSVRLPDADFFWVIPWLLTSVSATTCPCLSST